MNFRGSSRTPKTQHSTTAKSSPKKAARTTTSHHTTIGPNLGRWKDRTGNRAPESVNIKLILLIIILLIACTVVIKHRRTLGDDGPSSSFTAAAKLASERTTSVPHKTSTTTIRTTRTKNKHNSKYKYPMPDATVPPSHCTAEQLIALERQLSSTGCETPWVSKCSFRVLTQSCQDPVLAREYYAYDYNFTTQGHGFLGILIGYDHDDGPIDLLHIGNRQDPTYNVSTWTAVLNTTVPCVRKSIPYHRSKSNTRNPRESQPGGVEVPPPKVLVIETYPQPSTEASSSAKHLTLEQLKFRTLLPDEALRIHRVHQGYRSLNDVPSEDLRTVLETTTTSPPPSPPRAIQWFQIGNLADGAEYKIITDLLDTEFFREVRFLKFEYNFKGSWHWKQQPQQLSTLIDQLQTSVGMYCYWSGSSENGNMLWRITGCFLPHFDSHQFARIQCISTKHADVADLAFAMETKFLTLLQGTYTSF